MKLAWTAALLALSSAATAADVAVHLTSDGPATPHAAQAIAGAIFRRAGVSIEWRRESPPPPGALRVQLASQTRAGLHPGALAVAYPYAGSSRSVTVFLDRVRALAGGPARETALLAYVLVHEITHVIQGVDRHSDQGVMKACWSREDRAAVFARRLDFAEEDLEILRLGLAALNRRFESGIAGQPD